jgi:eukaryotic translation initiation factor 2C
MHNIRLRHPNIFGVSVTPKNAEKKIIYPAEVCEIQRGQLFKKKIPEELYTKPALDFATMRPSARLDTIRKGVTTRGPAPVTQTGLDGGSLQPPVCILRLPDHLADLLTTIQVKEHKQSEAILDSGMVIAEEPIRIQGRVLPTPNMIFGKGTLVCLFS